YVLTSLIALLLPCHLRFLLASVFEIDDAESSGNSGDCQSEKERFAIVATANVERQECSCHNTHDSPASIQVVQFGGVGENCRRVRVELTHDLGVLRHFGLETSPCDSVDCQQHDCQPGANARTKPLCLHGILNLSRYSIW